MLEVFSPIFLIVFRPGYFASPRIGDRNQITRSSSPKPCRESRSCEDRLLTPIAASCPCKPRPFAESSKHFIIVISA
jgi:hypothetical protein